jgi:hypothetical protein
MEKLAVILNNRLAISEDFLFFLQVPQSLIDINCTNLNESILNWESFYRKVESGNKKFFFIDTISQEIRDKYCFPSLKTLPNELISTLDPQKNQEKVISFLKTVLEVELSNNFRSAEKRYSILQIYLNKGYNISECNLLIKKHIVIAECLTLFEKYSGELIFKALKKLIESGRFGLSECFKEDFKCRGFYNVLSKGSLNRVEDSVIHALTGKPSNNPAICGNTKKLVAGLSMHFNSLPDQSVTNKVEIPRKLTTVFRGKLTT